MNALSLKCKVPSKPYGITFWNKGRWHKEAIEQIWLLKLPSCVLSSLLRNGTSSAPPSSSLTGEMAQWVKHLAHMQPEFKSSEPTLRQTLSHTSVIPVFLWEMGVGGSMGGPTPRLVPWPPCVEAHTPRKVYTWVHTQLCVYKHAYTKQAFTNKSTVCGLQD